MPTKPKKAAKRQSNKYSRAIIGNFYTSAAWRALRRLKLSKNPLCQHCERLNIITAGYMADHITPISEDGEALDINNLQTLCKLCHAIKTGKETAKRKQLKKQ